MQKTKTARPFFANGFFSKPPKQPVTAPGKTAGGETESSLPKPKPTQLIKRPVTAIRKKPKPISFADGVKSLIKAITKML